MEQSATWEKRKAEHRQYTMRRPELSPLYRIVYQERDNLERQWEAQFQPEYGCLRKEVLKTLDAYLDCGIPGHGAALAECENKECRYSLPVAFSCKKRFCPSCAAKRALIFAEHLHSEVLAAVAHRHLVLSIPKRLRPFIKYDRSLIDILFDAAWKSLQQMFEAVLPQGKPGAVLTVQTAGESANWNPHLHGIVSSGVFDPQGNFHELERLDTEKLEKLFCHHVLYALKEKNLITDTVVAQIMGQAHSGFGAWVGEKLMPGDESYRLFLAGYIDRGPVANSRLEIRDDIVTYHTEKDPLTHEFSALDFLARLTPQVADKWESTVRYYGHYSHRARGARRRAQEKAAALKEDKDGAGDAPTILPPVPACPELSRGEQKKKASKTWAALIRRVFEIEPLICPRCGSPMRIKSFITDTKEVKRLLDHLGITGFIKPAPILGAAPPDGLVLEPDPFPGI